VRSFTVFTQHILRVIKLNVLKWRGGFWWGILKESGCFEDLSINGRILLNGFKINGVGGHGLN
jgi:hypothetical protein